MLDDAFGLEPIVHVGPIVEIVEHENDTPPFKATAVAIKRQCRPCATLEGRQKDSGVLEIKSVSRAKQFAMHQCSGVRADTRFS
jgi:hypothetical protein